MVNLPELVEEIEKNESRGVNDWAKRLLLSDRAHLGRRRMVVVVVRECRRMTCSSVRLSQAERWADRTRSRYEQVSRSNNARANPISSLASLGTTKKGIGPTYSSKVGLDQVLRPRRPTTLVGHTKRCSSDRSHGRFLHVRRQVRHRSASLAEVADFSFILDSEVSTVTIK